MIFRLTQFTIKLNYSLPNPLISKSEGIIILSLLTDSGFSPTIKTTSIDVNHSNLLNLLLQYGDVRTFKSIDNLNFQVEFWDERDAEKAALSLEGGRWNDEGSVSFRFSCKFEPGLLVSTFFSILILYIFTNSTSFLSS